METLSGAQEFLKRVKRWQRIGALTPVGMGGPSRRGDNVGGELCRIGGGSVRKGGLSRRGDGGEQDLSHAGGMSEGGLYRGDGIGEGGLSHGGGNQGVTGVKTVHIIAIETGNEPHAIRATAEVWGASVTVTWVGNSGQVVDYLSGRPDHDLIIFSAHGDERGLLLPELHPEVARKYPYQDVITPSNFNEFLNLQGNIVINASCMGGRRELAEVFLARGASHYIGPVDYPQGDAALMYVLEFLYNHLCLGRSVGEAHQEASAHDDDRRMFVLYSIAKDHKHGSR